MFKKLAKLHLMVCFLLLLLVTGIILIGLPFKEQVHAQNFTVTPTFSCLGPCPTISSKSAPTLAPAQAAISPTNQNQTSSQPCSDSSLSPLTNGQAPAHRSGKFGNKGSKLGDPFYNKASKKFDGNSNDDRGGFLGIFFKFLLIIIDMLLQSTGSGGLSLPCSPALSDAPAPSNVPSINPVLPSITTSLFPIISAIPLSPTSGSTPIAVTPAPSNLKPDIGSWGGYTTSTTFPANSKITADWIVTQLDCSGGDGTISPWPGFGGSSQNDPNIAQLGNDMDCKNGKDTYPAWSEAYPASSVYYNNPMKAGDHMTATVTFQGNGKFATTMTNKTESWTITVPMNFASSYTPKTAEAILEVLGGSNNNQAAVPKFAPLSFSNSTYSVNGQQKPLASGPGLKLLELGSSGNAQVTTSAITGGNFTETFVHN